MWAGSNPPYQEIKTHINKWLLWCANLPFGLFMMRSLPSDWKWCIYYQCGLDPAPEGSIRRKHLDGLVYTESRLFHTELTAGNRTLNNSGFELPILFTFWHLDREANGNFEFYFMMDKIYFKLNPICRDILRFRAKTMPQIKRKWQKGANLAPTQGKYG